MDPVNSLIHGSGQNTSSLCWRNSVLSDLHSKDKHLYFRTCAVLIGQRVEMGQFEKFQLNWDERCLSLYRQQLLTLGSAHIHILWFIFKQWDIQTSVRICMTWSCFDLCPSPRLRVSLGWIMADWSVKLWTVIQLKESSHFEKEIWRALLLIRAWISFDYQSVGCVCRPWD